VLTRDDAEAIHAYVLDQAWQAYDAERVAAKTSTAR
jgi:hypothetical protein